MAAAIRALGPVDLEGVEEEERVGVPTEDEGLRRIAYR